MKYLLLALLLLSSGLALAQDPDNSGGTIDVPYEMCEFLSKCPDGTITMCNQTVNHAGPHYGDCLDMMDPGEWGYPDEPGGFWDWYYGGPSDGGDGGDD